MDLNGPRILADQPLFNVQPISPVVHPSAQLDFRCRQSQEQRNRLIQSQNFTGLCNGLYVLNSAPAELGLGPYPELSSPPDCFFDRSMYSCCNRSALTGCKRSNPFSTVGGSYGCNREYCNYGNQEGCNPYTRRRTLACDSLSNSLHCSERIPYYHGSFMASSVLQKNYFPTFTLTESPHLPKWKRRKSSKYIGVYLKKETNKWRARIHHNGKTEHLGNYEDEKEAALAYNDRAKEIGRKTLNTID